MLLPDPKVLRWRDILRAAEEESLRGMGLLHPRYPTLVVRPGWLRPVILHTAMRLMRYRIPTDMTDGCTAGGAGDSGDDLLFPVLTCHHPQA